jgi:hypothetical protein
MWSFGIFLTCFGMFGPKKSGNPIPLISNCSDTEWKYPDHECFVRSSWKFTNTENLQTQKIYKHRKFTNTEKLQTQKSYKHRKVTNTEKYLILVVQPFFFKQPPNTLAGFDLTTHSYTGWHDTIRLRVRQALCQNCQWLFSFFCRIYVTCVGTQSEWLMQGEITTSSMYIHRLYPTLLRFKNPEGSFLKLA